MQRARFDQCLNYKEERLSEALARVAPEGIHVVFDNVGGETLEAAMANLAMHSRVVLSGSISSGYKNHSYGVGPRNYMELGFKRARMEGFIFLDYASRFPQAFHQLRDWHQTGEINYNESISYGLEQAPAALCGLFTGKNIGKQIVEVANYR